jgi:HSP20 family protein
LSGNDVRVEATDDGLVIEGERKREHSTEEGGWQRSERVYGRFYRLIPLAENARIEEAQANFRDGVLEVNVPVPESERKRRQIPIGTGQKANLSGTKAAAAVAGR